MDSIWNKSAFGSKGGAWPNIHVFICSRHLIQHYWRFSSSLSPHADARHVRSWPASPRPWWESSSLTPQKRHLCHQRCSKSVSTYVQKACMQGEQRGTILQNRTKEKSSNLRYLNSVSRPRGIFFWNLKAEKKMHTISLAIPLIIIENANILPQHRATLTTCLEMMEFIIVVYTIWKCRRSSSSLLWIWKQAILNMGLWDQIYVYVRKWCAGLRDSKKTF